MRPSRTIPHLALAATALWLNWALPTHSAAASEPEITIPMHTTHGGQYAVATTVEGYGPMDFLVDTGANRTAVLTPLAVKLGLLAQDQQDAVLHGMTGTIDTRILRVDELDFGMGNVGPLDTALVPLAPDVYLTAHGLLGADAFDSEIIAIDFASEELRVGVPSPQPNIRRHLFEIDADGLLRADIIVSGIRATAIIDTGSTHTIANSALINAVSVSRPAMFLDMSGVTGGSGVQAGTVFVETMRLGGVCQRGFRVLRSDVEIFETLDLDGEPAIIIGLDFLATATITIDRPGGVFQITSGTGTCRGRSTSLRE
jgi:predicted aspartyl protease